jgi:hypothetical protein
MHCGEEYHGPVVYSWLHFMASFRVRLLSFVNNHDRHPGPAIRSASPVDWGSAIARDVPLELH